MNSKELVIRALHGEKTDIIPAGVHGWGMYKFALMGIVSDYSKEKEAWKIHGEELAKIEENFQEIFNPDYMHLAEAFFESKKEIINGPKYKELLEAVRKLNSEKVIDEFLDIVYLSAEELKKKKKFDHLKILSKKYGDDIFIFLETEGPIHDIFDSDGIMGFEHGMVQMIDNPKLFFYLGEGMYRRQLKYVEAVKDCGAHGYAQSISYLGADLSSPEIYKNYVVPIQKEFYKEVEKIGLIPIMNFWGNVTPIVKYIKTTNIKGVLIDESRKGYVLDVGEIKRELGNEIGLFGNVSSEHTLLKGSVEDVKNEVISQIKKTGLNGGFLSCCGPPITFGTPVENVKALIDTARNFKI
ncbi:MAG: uroporphyrinogen decarboxylase family protein [bacterium]|nr:uroporphyrinogen decarboxylase family protein [bacterium]